MTGQLLIKIRERLALIYIKTLF